MSVTNCDIPNPGDPDCPVRGILDKLGDKWTTLVITSLAEGKLRFSEIRKRIPDISQRMLTEALRSLERDGVLVRTVYPTSPPRVDYSLSALGHSLLPLVNALVSWALEHRLEIHSARASYDAAKSKPLVAVSKLG